MATPEVLQAAYGELATRVQALADVADVTITPWLNVDARGVGQISTSAEFVHSQENENFYGQNGP